MTSNFTTSSLKDATEKMVDSRKRTSQVIDSLYLELEDLSEKIVTCPSSSEMWNFRDRLEDIRGSIYKLIKSTTRNIGSARETYEAGMREAMVKVKNTGGLHFSEREATYQIKNIDAYKILTNLERSLSDLQAFSRYLDGRLQWVKDRQRWLSDREKRL